MSCLVCGYLTCDDEGGPTKVSFSIHLAFLFLSSFSSSSSTLSYCLYCVWKMCPVNFLLELPVVVIQPFSLWVDERLITICPLVFFSSLIYFEHEKLNSNVIDVYLIACIFMLIVSTLNFETVIVIYICMYVCMCMYVCICMYVCVYSWKIFCFPIIFD